MLATLGHLPPSGSDAGWGFEMKWDGVRAIAYVIDGQLRLISRNDADMTVSYPELTRLPAQLAHGAAFLDGEIVSLTRAGRPSFSQLQKRMHVQDPVAANRLATAEPVVFYVFDLLVHDGMPLIGQSYEDRRAALEGLEIDESSWQVPPAFRGSGQDAVRASQSLQLEGVVAKRLASTYRPGQRSKDWVKIKNLRTQEVVIGGWSAGLGHRAQTLGALLVGIPTPNGLAYAGKVGTGFTESMLSDLLADLAPLASAEAPFIAVPKPDARAARWVLPVLVGEVVFSEWTGEGRLRHPVWRGLRPDKSAADVVLES